MGKLKVERFDSFRQPARGVGKKKNKKKKVKKKRLKKGKKKSKKNPAFANLNIMCDKFSRSEEYRSNIQSMCPKKFRY